MRKKKTEEASCCCQKVVNAGRVVSRGRTMKNFRRNKKYSEMEAEFNSEPVEATKWGRFVSKFTAVI